MSKHPIWKALPAQALGKMLIRLSLTLCLAVTACSDQSSNRSIYILTTGSTGGTYYPVGVALSTLVKSKSNSGFSLSAISSAGSMENIKLLRDNQAQFGLILGTFAAWAWNGEGPIRNPQTHLRSISSMWPNVEHFILLSDLVSSGTMSDLAKLGDQRFVLGMRNSGAEQTGYYIFDKLGIDYSDYNFGYMGYGATVGAMQDGNIVGMNIPAGAPVTAVTRAFAQLGDKITVLNFTQEEVDAINAGSHLWDLYELAPNTYPNQIEAITTASSSNVLVVRDDVDEEIVYEFTKALWENLAILQEIHSATKEMRLQIALQGIAVPLHPGALRFYREQGLEIPAHLLL
ncbi:MAG: C4-dicarboxylate ABC transporter substrate-binding protein [SAR86 cluster bacterium]|uniref:C4-dicarboxylate ABC transporter substrate-binding protein n=1 Tax=SAR86 cluster bacterium TaxID=2030880 RepID=A0A2A4MW83_9GAMM|nr:MAG: C4-dicarboxylate ABC transporter substrate-binding protein [SAR86 cluster bacterium]